MKNLSQHISFQSIIMSLFNFLILSTPLYFRFVSSELFEFNKMILVYSLSVIIGFFWVARMIYEKKIIVRATPLDYPLLFFAVSMLLSTVLSIHPYTSLFGYYSRFNGGLASLLTYIFLFYAFVSNAEKKDITGFLWSSYIVAGLVSIYGILEHFGHSISCLLVPGVQTFGVDCWIQDVQSRVFASFGQPNWLAAFVITLFPLVIASAVAKHASLKQKILSATLAIALFLTLLYTKSRSGLLGAVAGMFAFDIGIVWLSYKQKQRLKEMVSLPETGIILLIFTAIILIVGTSFTPNLNALIVQKQSVSEPLENQEIQAPQTQNTPEPVVDRLTSGGTDSGEIRKIVWTGAVAIWQRYPFFGSGVETFAYSYYQDRTREHNDVSEWDFLYNKAHNEPLNLLATTGIFGLVSYLSIFVFFAYMTFGVMQSTAHSNKEKITVLAIFSGQIALFISNFFGFSTVSVNVLMFCFFAITCILADPNVNQKSDRQSERLKHTRLGKTGFIQLSMLAIFCLIVLGSIRNYWLADKAHAESKGYFSAGNYQLAATKQLEAITRSPREGLYYETLSDQYAQLAAQLQELQETTAAAEMASQSVLASDASLALNSRHLNFYKTRTRVMVTLSALNPSYLELAKEATKQAIVLSPTDPKLLFTLAVLEQNEGNLDEALRLFEQATVLKPDYERAYWKIGEVYELQENYDQARSTYDFILERISPNNQEILQKKSAIEQKLEEK